MYNIENRISSSLFPYVCELPTRSLNAAESHWLKALDIGAFTL